MADYIPTLLYQPVFAPKPLHDFCSNSAYLVCNATNPDFWLGWYSSCFLSDDCAKEIGFPWGERYLLSNIANNDAVIVRFCIRIFFFFACIATFRFIARSVILKPILALFSKKPNFFEKLEPSHSSQKPAVSKHQRRKDRMASDKVQRYFEAGWYAMWYPVSLLLGIYVLSQEEDLVREQSNHQWGVLDSASWWHGWPKIRQDAPIVDNFYLIQLAFNVQCLIQIVFIESRKKDFRQMVSHHIITILLIWCSYFVGLMRIGLIIITVVADGPDLFLYWAKVRCTPALAPNNAGRLTRLQVCHYLQDKHPLKDFFFAIFALSFYILRGIYYPVFVCMAVAIEHPLNVLEHWWFFCLLWGLYLLYLYWMYLIGIMVYKLVVEKDLGGDVRCVQHSPYLAPL